VIYKSREDYLRGVSSVIGPLARQTTGAYVMTSNRMFMYDAFGGRTGVLLNAANTRNSPSAIEARTELYEENVSNIVHEAIHQVAFNTGFHNRMAAGNPLWLVEGMAMFFETPDTSARNGWKGVGNVNKKHLDHLRKIWSQLPMGCLDRLVADDTDLREPATMRDSYALAWALTYYLARSKAKGYAQYIRTINDRPLMTPYPPEERLRDFRAAFGKDPAGLELDFRRNISRMLSETP
jgi:hypothetical protein